MDYVENTHEVAERVKRWWGKYGNILITIVIIIMVVILGLQYWHKHQYKVASQASIAYENLLSSTITKNHVQTQGLANQLMQEYSSSPYAKFAAFILAQQAVNDNKLPLAAKNLQWVVGHAKSATIKAVAQLRLSRVLLAERKAQQALAILHEVTERNMLAIADSLKGDAFLVLKQRSKAKLAYAKALQAMPKNSVLYEYTQMKLYSL